MYHFNHTSIQNAIRDIGSGQSESEDDLGRGGGTGCKSLLYLNLLQEKDYKVLSLPHNHSSGASLEGVCAH